MAAVTRLSTEDTQHIQSGVLELALAHVPEQFFLLAVDFEKEAGTWFLRIYLEGRDHKISLDECADVSRTLDTPLDAFAPLKDMPYTLEVSSPGAFRPLTTAREFAFYQGRSVTLHSYQKKALPLKTGTIHHFDEASNTVFISPPESPEAPVSVLLSVEPPITVTLAPHPARSAQDDDSFQDDNNFLGGSPHD